MGCSAIAASMAVATSSLVNRDPALMSGRRIPRYIDTTLAFRRVVFGTGDFATVFMAPHIRHIGTLGQHFCVPTSERYQALDAGAEGSFGQDRFRGHGRSCAALSRILVNMGLTVPAVPSLDFGLERGNRKPPAEPDYTVHHIELR